MITNVVDRRERPHRWRRINAIIEATWNDNPVADSDQADRPDDEVYVMYDAREGISLADAVAWAQAETCPVTLYLYDEGKGTT